jgi:hypothetical protein
LQPDFKEASRRREFFLDYKKKRAVENCPVYFGQMRMVFPVTMEWEQLFKMPTSQFVYPGVMGIKA